MLHKDGSLSLGVRTQDVMLRECIGARQTTVSDGMMLFMMERLTYDTVGVVLALSFNVNICHVDTHTIHDQNNLKLAYGHFTKCAHELGIGYNQR